MCKEYSCAEIYEKIIKEKRSIRTVRHWFQNVPQVNDPQEKTALYEENMVADVLAKHGFIEFLTQRIISPRPDKKQNDKKDEFEKAIAILGKYNARISIPETINSDTEKMEDDIDWVTKLLTSYGIRIDRPNPNQLSLF